ncbi:hypothetical protein LEMLEM_LOCUS8785 [Lemmus lemmus]
MGPDRKHMSRYTAWGLDLRTSSLLKPSGDIIASQVERLHQILQLLPYFYM